MMMQCEMKFGIHNVVSPTEIEKFDLQCLLKRQKRKFQFFRFFQLISSCPQFCSHYDNHSLSHDGIIKINLVPIKKRVGHTHS